MERRRKAQIFPTWASGVSSNVLRVTDCCILIYMFITQALNYYPRLLRIVTQMALAPLFCLSSIASFLAATTRISRASADQWRAEGGGLGCLTPPPKFRSFDKAEPNSQVHGKCIRKNLIRIRVSLICKLSATPD
jgi:hypothetical protein